ncbi:HTH_Tnp_Tc3_2 domain-containing protein [Trichonephila clavipes]|nr:HTH_Tnp_Tc3_2 domain-containing protein [Trichonephila clavipes]
MNKEGKKDMHRPGIEPGPPAWQASILPLNHRCDSDRNVYELNANNPFLRICNASRNFRCVDQPHHYSLPSVRSGFNKTNSVENKQRSGRSRIFKEHEERWILRQVHINPRTSALKMTLQCKSRFGKSVSPETVRYVLRKHKYHGRVPQRKPYISKANRQARLAFAKMYGALSNVDLSGDKMLRNTGVERQRHSRSVEARSPPVRYIVEVCREWGLHHLNMAQTYEVCRQ